MVSRSSVKGQFLRIRALFNGKVEWIDEDGRVEKEYMSWRTRWALFGVHSYTWKWVRRNGTRPCGCTFNPITRRKVLTQWNCSQHGTPSPVEDYHGKATASE